MEPATETPKQSHIEMTNSSVKRNQRNIVLTAGSTLHFFHDGIADGLAIFLPLWQASFGLTLAQVGLLVTCFEGATGFFQIPAGLLGERFGERKLLVLGTAVWLLSAVVTSTETATISSTVPIADCSISLFCPFSLRSITIGTIVEAELELLPEENSDSSSPLQPDRMRRTTNRMAATGNNLLYLFCRFDLVVCL